MTPNEVIMHQDFNKLINFASSKYNLYPRIKSFDDFCQDVAVNILEYPNGLNKISMAHFVIKHCIWVSCKYVKQRNKKKRFLKVDNFYSDSSFDEVDSREESDRILGKLTPKQASVLKLRMDGFDNTEIAQKMKCSRQNIHCILKYAVGRVDYEQRRYSV